MRELNGIPYSVALRKESVDRNHPAATIMRYCRQVALRKESVDRNVDNLNGAAAGDTSLSARRAWIEIIDDLEPSTTRRVALRKESVDRN